MTISELNDKIYFLEEICENEKFRLRKSYALSNNNVKIGDVINDEIGDVINDETKTIKIETIGIYLSSIPQCVYTGIVLTKKRFTK